MPQWFFVSDLHLEHTNVIKYCKRPFLSFEEESNLQLAESGVVSLRDVKISQETTNRMTTQIIDSINAQTESKIGFVAPESLHHFTMGQARKRQLQVCPAKGLHQSAI